MLRRGKVQGVRDLGDGITVLLQKGARRLYFAVENILLRRTAVFGTENADDVGLIQVEVPHDVVQRHVIAQSRVDEVLDALGGADCGTLMPVQLVPRGQQHLTENALADADAFRRVFGIDIRQRLMQLLKVVQCVRAGHDHRAVGEAAGVDHAVQQASARVDPDLMIGVVFVRPVFVRIEAAQKIEIPCLDLIVPPAAFDIALTADDVLKDIDAFSVVLFAFAVECVGGRGQVVPHAFNEKEVIFRIVRTAEIENASRVVKNRFHARLPGCSVQNNYMVSRRTCQSGEGAACRNLSEQLCLPEIHRGVKQHAADVGGDHFTDADGEHEIGDRPLRTVGKAQDGRNDEHIGKHGRQRHEPLVFAQGIGAERADERCQAAENDVGQRTACEQIGKQTAGKKTGHGSTREGGQHTERLGKAHLDDTLVQTDEGTQPCQDDVERGDQRAAAEKTKIAVHKKSSPGFVLGEEGRELTMVIIRLSASFRKPRNLYKNRKNNFAFLHWNAGRDVVY